jgi:GNAT superfamily N-acetyltransferase
MLDQEKIEIREYHPGDEESIIDLLERVFRGWPKFDLSCSKLDHWKWKYVDRPFEGVFAAVALDGYRLVGCQHSPYVNLKIGEGVYLCECGGDLAIDPEYRGRGIWSRMTSVWDKHRKTDYILGYSNSFTEVVIKKVKATKSLLFPSSVKHYTRIKDIDRYLEVKKSTNKLIKKLGFLGLKWVSSFRSIFLGVNLSMYEVSSIVEFDDRINDLWDYVKCQYNVVVERKKEYLNWRFCDSRGGEYEVRIVEDKGSVLGYSVLRINRDNPNYPEGYIVEIFSIDDVDVAESLFNDACIFFDENGVEVVHYWAPSDHYYSKIIYKYGLLDAMSELLIWFGNSITPGLGEEIESSEKDRVFFQIGDLDWI